MSERRARTIGARPKSPLVAAMASNPREELAKVVAGDARYAVEAYEFVLAALELAKRKKRRRAKSSGRPASGKVSRHVSGRELCRSSRDLAAALYGRLAPTVLGAWGLYATADIGAVVYNMIRVGSLSASEQDSEDDFRNVFDFETVFVDEYRIRLKDEDEVF